MKKSLRLFAIFFVAISLITLFAIDTSAESDNSLRYGRQTLYSRPNSSALVYVYDKLASECASYERPSISIQGGYSITLDELHDVFNIFLNDYPEYFWLTGGYNYTTVSGKLTSIKPGYKSWTKNQLIAMKQELDSKVNELTFDLANKSQYDKSVILHDRLAACVEYVSTANDQTAYGALVEGRAVCAGYAKAYQLLLHKVGIPGWYVRGSSKTVNSGQTVNHAWNLVSIDGKWYYTDVTWDDQGETTYHAYLNLPFATIEEDHTAIDFNQYLPVSNSYEANYFYRNGLIMNSFSEDAVASLLKNNEFETSIFVMCDFNTFKKQLTDNFRNIIKKTGVSYSSYSYKLKYIGREMIISVTLKGGSNILQHVHMLTRINAVEPTCSKGGNITYYPCACGKYFADPEAKIEILNKNSVLLPKSDHEPLDSYKYDTNEHWYTCRFCNNIIASSIGAHADSNKDYSCDTCGYNIPKQTGSTTAATANTTQSENNNDLPNNNELPVTTAPQSSDDVPHSTDAPQTTPQSDDTPDTSATESTGKDITLGNESKPTSPNDNDNDNDNEPSDQTQSSNKMTTVFTFVAIGFGAVGVSCITVSIFIKKR